MNSTRSPALRAKPISWVTTSMVMPSRASEVITSSTSLTISGSSALVGSSNSITFGCIASARAIATRCCWPPESWAGSLSFCASMPDPLQQRDREVLRLLLVHLADLDRPEGDVLQDRLVREEVERLEHHPDVGPQLGQGLALGGQRHAVDLDPAGVDRFQPVDRPAQRRLAGAGRARGRCTTWPAGTSSWMFLSTCRAPKCFSTSCIATMGRSPVRRPGAPAVPALTCPPDERSVRGRPRHRRVSRLSYRYRASRVRGNDTYTRSIEQLPVSRCSVAPADRSAPTLPQRDRRGGQVGTYR